MKIDSIRRRMEFVFAEWEAMVGSQKVAEVEVPFPPKYQHWVVGAINAILPAQPDTAQATVKILTQLRSGPGMEFPIAGTKSVGALVEIDGMNSTGTWLRLTDGSWILRRAFCLVRNASGRFSSPTTAPHPAIRTFYTRRVPARQTQESGTRGRHAQVVPHPELRNSGRGLPWQQNPVSTAIKA